MGGGGESDSVGTLEEKKIDPNPNFSKIFSFHGSRHSHDTQEGFFLQRVNRGLEGI